MSAPDPTDSFADARERHIVAELLGRILATYWLARRQPTIQMPARPASAEPPLTTPPTDTYDGR